MIMHAMSGRIILGSGVRFFQLSKILLSVRASVRYRVAQNARYFVSIVGAIIYSIMYFASIFCCRLVHFFSCK